MTEPLCLRFPGDADRPTVLFVPPLFEEANRLRRTLVQTMRALSRLGIATMLPDLPGQNESVVPSEAVTLHDWRSALHEVAVRETGPLIVASWRGGALIDDAAAAIGYWRMAPITGASIVKMMLRTRIAGEKEAGRVVTADGLRAIAAQGHVELAGSLINANMLAQLDAAAPAAVDPLLEVRLGDGPDAFPGSALWLRGEPGEDPIMATAMAHSLKDWAETCATR